MMQTFESRFRPRDGALLDLDSLVAISQAPGQVLQAQLLARWPGATSLVLEGLQISGAEVEGPPGTRRPDSTRDSVLVSPGAAIVTGPDGLPTLVQLRREESVPWPVPKLGSAVAGVLALLVEEQPESAAGGLTVARSRLRVRLGFAKLEQASAPHILPLARSIGNSRDWATDIRRLVVPEDPIVQGLIAQAKKLEGRVWDADPKGAVWDNAVMGRHWVRYQTVAVAALQSAAMQLHCTAMTTQERVRLLTHLRRQLRDSVEEAADILGNQLGRPEYADAYRSVVEL
jgi:hypothetical protein